MHTPKLLWFVLLLQSLSILAINSIFFCWIVNNSSLKSLHIVINDWFCSFRWHMTSFKLLLSLLWSVASRECGSTSDLLVDNESGGEDESRGVGFRYTSNALDRCDDWNDGMNERGGSCKLSSVSNDWGWFRSACQNKINAKSWKCLESFFCVAKLLISEYLHQKSLPEIA